MKYNELSASVKNRIVKVIVKLGENNKCPFYKYWFPECQDLRTISWLMRSNVGLQLRYVLGIYEFCETKEAHDTMKHDLLDPLVSHIGVLCWNGLTGKDWRLFIFFGWNNIDGNILQHETPFAITEIRTIN